MSVHAIERGLPLLGICRGMQILNVAFGGTLERNLVAADGSHAHRKVVGTFDGNERTIKLADGHWGLGVRWHPEADDRSRLFGALLEEAREYASRRSTA